jgi:hypothetical protein
VSLRIAPVVPIVVALGVIVAILVAWLALHRAG